MKKWATNYVTGLKGSCFIFVGPFVGDFIWQRSLILTINDEIT